MAGPPEAVLSAFGLRGRGRRLPGGEGTSWLVDGVVLKPRADPDHQEWLGTQLAGIRQSGFRLPDVRRSVTGAWVVRGWGAQSAVAGTPSGGEETDWRVVVGVARALHAATAALPRPAFLEDRTGPWATADRMAWGETPVAVAPEDVDVVTRLACVPAPVGPPQLVHGDLTTNVLLHDRAPPAVIDFSPYWRPAAYAEGVIVADALCWHGASTDLLHEVSVSREAVARALLFRFLTASLMRPWRDPKPAAEAERCCTVIAALGL